MMGTTHALSGLCVGLWVAPLVGVHGPAGTIVFAALTAGYALFNDLDHDTATASKFLGPVTWLLSQAVQSLSRIVYQATKGPRDEDVAGDHRHLTHTLIWAASMGLLSGWGGSKTPWVGGGLIVLGVLLAADRLGDWVIGAAALAVLLWLGSQHAGGTVPSIPATLVDLHATIGIAVFLGHLVHDLGDMLTEHGVPLLWPLPILGETWYELRPPSWIRFRTGKKGETVVLVVLLIAIAGYAWMHIEPRLPAGHPEAGRSSVRPVDASRDPRRPASSCPHQNDRTTSLPPVHPARGSAAPKVPGTDVDDLDRLIPHRNWDLDTLML